MKALLTASLLLTLAPSAARAQINAGEQRAEPTMPFTMTQMTGGATPAERWRVGHRIRDVEVGPDGALWVLEDANPGALFRVTPK